MLECHLGITHNLSETSLPEPSQKCQWMMQQGIPQLVSLFDQLLQAEAYPIVKLAGERSWLVGSVEEDLDPDDWRDVAAEDAARAWLSAAPERANYVRIQASTNLDTGEWIDCVFAVSQPIKRSALMMLETALERAFDGRRPQNFKIPPQTVLPKYQRL